eukprot:14819665-Alexandrium_andersonii.AAC.1
MDQLRPEMNPTAKIASSVKAQLDDATSMLVKSMQLGVSRCAGHDTMAAPTVEGGLPPQRLTGAPSEPPPNGPRTRGESALTERLGAPHCSAPSCCVKASSPIVRHPFGAALRAPQ